MPVAVAQFDANSIPINVVSDDGVIMCINKQPGVIVQPSGAKRLENMIVSPRAQLPPGLPMRVPSRFAINAARKGSPPCLAARAP